MALEVVSSTLTTHPIKKRLEKAAFSLSLNILGCSQAVRQRTLTPSSRGSESRQPSQKESHSCWGGFLFCCVVVVWSDSIKCNLGLQAVLQRKIVPSSTARSAEVGAALNTYRSDEGNSPPNPMPAQPRKKTLHFGVSFFFDL